MERVKLKLFELIYVTTNKNKNYISNINNILF